jgi:carbamoyl-phosphate synthase / aspartate carbamoyltransferase / dihydroorotase
LIFLHQIQALDWWPSEDSDQGLPQIQQCTIAQLLADNHFSLVINLPFRNAGTRAASSFVTQGYRTRRMAVEYSVPLITDIKCTKLLFEVLCILVRISVV